MSEQPEIIADQPQDVSILERYFFKNARKKEIEQELSELRDQIKLMMESQGKAMLMDGGYIATLDQSTRTNIDRKALMKMLSEEQWSKVTTTSMIKTLKVIRGE